MNATVGMGDVRTWVDRKETRRNPGPGRRIEWEVITDRETQHDFLAYEGADRYSVRQHDSLAIQFLWLKTEGSQSIDEVLPGHDTHL